MAAKSKKLLWLGASGAAIGGLAYLYTRKSRMDKMTKVADQYDTDAAKTKFEGVATEWVLVPQIQRELLLKTHPPVGTKRERTDVLIPQMAGYEASHVANFWKDTVLDLYQRSVGKWSVPLDAQTQALVALRYKLPVGGDPRLIHELAKFEDRIATIAKSENCCPTSFFCALAACQKMLSKTATQDFWYAVDKFAVGISTYLQYTPDPYLGMAWDAVGESAETAGRTAKEALNKAGKAAGGILNEVGRLLGGFSANLVWGFLAAGATGVAVLVGGALIYKKLSK